jgi:multicomponent Na+:H+ antiporter subunit G
MIAEWFMVVLIVIGAAFSLLAAVGVLRMPDLYMRLQATTKSATLGVVCVVVAASIHFDDTATTTKAVLVVAFLFLTAPVAAQVIARAAYGAGIPMWEQTIVDEMMSAMPKPLEPPPEAATAPEQNTRPEPSPF